MFALLGQFRVAVKVSSIAKLNAHLSDFCRAPLPLQADVAAATKEDWDTWENEVHLMALYWLN